MILLDENRAKDFLIKNNIQNYEIKKIAGDASFRSYYRIFSGTEKFILMFAPPTHEDIRPFEKVADFLVEHNFSAPKIFARDEENGFLLLEDLGDDTYSRVLAKLQNQQLIEAELDLYKNACDCLLELQNITPPQNLTMYNHALLFREVMLFIDWYLPLQKKNISLAEKAQFKFLWFQLFDLLNKEEQILVLRDYHADNLMFLPQRNNHQKVGLLDFQDGVIGSKAYDLVSLLEDARRDLDSKNREDIFNYYLERFSGDKAAFTRDYKILSLQRNIKIIGIFSRLSTRDGKHNYLNFLPRMLNFVTMRLDCQNPMFNEIGNFLKKFIN